MPIEKIAQKSVGVQPIRECNFRRDGVVESLISDFEIDGNTGGKRKISRNAAWHNMSSLSIKLEIRMRIGSLKVEDIKSIISSTSIGEGGTRFYILRESQGKKLDSDRFSIASSIEMDFNLRENECVEKVKSLYDSFFDDKNNDDPNYKFETRMKACYVAHNPLAQFCKGGVISFVRRNILGDNSFKVSIHNPSVKENVVRRRNLIMTVNADHSDDSGFGNYIEHYFVKEELKILDFFISSTVDKGEGGFVPVWHYDYFQFSNKTYLKTYWSWGEKVTFEKPAIRFVSDSSALGDVRTVLLNKLYTPFEDDGKRNHVYEAKVLNSMYRDILDYLEVEMKHIFALNSVKKKKKKYRGVKTEEVKEEAPVKVEDVVESVETTATIETESV